MEKASGPDIMHKAAALLARRAYSRGELSDKLAAMGNPEQIEGVLDRLEQLHLLNDADYAYNSACRWVKQDGWGPEKLLQQLVRRKIPDSIAADAVARVRAEVGDDCALKAYLSRLRRTRPLPEDRKGVSRLIQSLQRRGWPQDVIWRVLRHSIPSEVRHDFETGE